jgi:hypothetical protein
MKSIIIKRLKHFGWDKGIVKFIEFDAFYILLTLSYGNPRIAFNILQNAMQIVHDKNALIISQEDVINGAKENQFDINNDYINIIKFLIEKESSYANDEMFQDFVKLSYKPLKDRLEELYSFDLVIEFQKKVHTKPANYYRLHDLDWK